MKIIRDPNGEYSDCLVSYFNFEQFDDGDDDVVLFYGYSSSRNQRLLDKYKDKTKIFFSTEQPCGFESEPDVHINLGEPFDLVYTPCPYTGDWLNNTKYGRHKYILSCLPCCSTFLSQDNYDKKYDAIYWGGVYHPILSNIVKTISKFKYNYFTTTCPGNLGHLLTGTSIPRQKMWDILRETKIMVTSNLLYYDKNKMNVIKSIDRYEENKAFSKLETMTMPQIKTRVFEAALNKTLLLIRKDEWNVIEHWFEPDKDFLYYTDETLENKINEISTNWNNYTDIVNNAYKKAINNYTTQQVMSEIERDIDAFCKK